MSNSNDVIKMEGDTNLIPPKYGDLTQIAIADAVVAKIMQKEDNFYSKLFPSKEYRARTEKDIELISQALGDRNKMYAILRETQIKNFTLAANNFLTDQMVKSNTYIAGQISTSVNDAIEKIDRETERFYYIIQKKQDRAENWQGSRKDMILKSTSNEIEILSDQFNQLAIDLINDLIKLKENLIK